MSIKTAVKAALSVVIIALVLHNIDERLLLATMARANAGWLLWALGWFVVSKIISALRFNILLAAEGVELPARQNLRLYWIGMYYNLLLPGGISGDGYKIKLLMDRFGATFRRMFAVSLFDRVSGVVALGQLCLVLAIGIPALRPFWWVALAGILISIPVSKLVCRRFGGELDKVWRVAMLLSLAVQIAQLVATLGIVLALGEAARWLEYSLLFLVSSVVAMLPLTIGGTGARELTFLWGASFLSVDPENAVAIAFLFYLISTSVALPGMALSFNPKMTESEAV